MYCFEIISISSTYSLNDSLLFSAYEDSLDFVASIT